MGIGDWGLGIGDWAQSPLIDLLEYEINHEFFMKLTVLIINIY